LRGELGADSNYGDQAQRNGDPSRPRKSEGRRRGGTQDLAHSSYLAPHQPQHLAALALRTLARLVDDGCVRRKEQVLMIGADGQPRRCRASAFRYHGVGAGPVGVGCGLDGWWRKRATVQHVGRHEQRGREALGRVGPEFAAIRLFRRLLAQAPPVARSRRPVDDVSLLLVHLRGGSGPVRQNNRICAQLC
jgi:hypothetical protein